MVPESVHNSHNQFGSDFVFLLPTTSRYKSCYPRKGNWFKQFGEYMFPSCVLVAASSLQMMFAEKINVQMLLSTVTELPTPIKQRCLRGMTEIKDL